MPYVRLRQDPAAWVRSHPPVQLPPIQVYGLRDLVAGFEAYPRVNHSEDRLMHEWWNYGYCTAHGVYQYEGTHVGCPWCQKGATVPQQAGAITYIESTGQTRVQRIRDAQDLYNMLIGNRAVSEEALAEMLLEAYDKDPDDFIV